MKCSEYPVGRFLTFEFHDFKLTRGWERKWNMGDGPFWMSKTSDRDMLRFTGVVLPSYEIINIDLDKEFKFAYVSGKHNDITGAQEFKKAYGGKVFVDGEEVKEID